WDSLMKSAKEEQQNSKVVASNMNKSRSYDENSTRSFIVDDIWRPDALAHIKFPKKFQELAETKEQSKENNKNIDKNKMVTFATKERTRKEIEEVWEDNEAKELEKKR